MLRYRSTARFALPFAALLITTACVENGRDPELSDVDSVPSASDSPAPAVSNQNIANPTLATAENDPIDPGDDLVLVWSDEFDGASLDPATWFFATGRGEEAGLPPGWGNDELQYYLPDNAQVEGGVLKITAKRETFGGQPYTSARILTEDRFAFQYGRIEASIKLPSGQGIWPAFWMLSQDSPYGIWAATGEIDIVEAVNLDGVPRPDNPDADGGGNTIFGTIYYGGEFPNQEFSSETYIPSVDVTESFNTYAVEWDVNEIRWYFNDVLYATQNSWFSTAAPYPAPFDQPFYILLNVAVGGNFPGFPDADTPFPATMEVDYVRVYEGVAPFVPADPGITPDNVVYASDPMVVEDLPIVGLNNFGSGAMFDTAFAGDPDFDPAIQVTSGTDFGGEDVGFVAFTGYTAGFAQTFENFVFKVKADAANLTNFEVKFIGGTDTSMLYDLTSYPGVTDLGNGWLQVVIPMSDVNANIAVNDGFLLGPLGDQGAPYSYLLTDIGFTGTVSTPADPGITPDNVVFASDPMVIADLPIVGLDNFGSAAAFDTAFAGDSDFSPAIQVTSGQGFGGQDVGFIAFTGYTAGFAETFQNFVFKVKADAANQTNFEVKFIGGTDTSRVLDLTTYGGVTDLGNGWLQVVVPMSEFAANIAANNGFLLGPLGDQGAPFSYLLTDIGFTGTSADPGVIPENVVYASDPSVAEDIGIIGLDNFGSAAMFEANFTGDADFNPALQVMSGQGFGGQDVGFIAFTGYAAGFAQTYDNFVFKIKGDAANLTNFEVKFIGGTDTSMLYNLTSYSGATDLGNGWLQVVIPMTDFAANIAVNNGFLVGPLGDQGAPYSYLLTDIGFVAAGSGGTGEVAVNGGFEDGNFTGWTQFEATLGDQTIVMGMAGNTSSEGSFHLEINNTATGTNSLIKQERVGLGAVVPGVGWTVTFDARGSFGPGGVAFAQVFSETAGGPENCTGCGILGGAPLALDADPTVWTSFTFSGTAGPNTESLTLQLEAVTGGSNLANVFYDNVSITID